MSDYPRVAGVLSQQGTDLSALCNAVADRYSFPPRLLVACGMMESRLDEQSERRGVWPDTSAGLFHQTVKWATAYGLGNGQNTPENIAEVFAELKDNPALAADIAGQQLGRWWAQEGDGLNALSRYNSPGLAWAENPNRRNIADSWEASAAYVGEEATVDGWQPDDVRDLFPYVPGREYEHRGLGAIRGVVYHHGASALPAPTREAELAMLQQYHALHTQTHGWPAIGYHLAVGPSGAVYWLNGLDLITYHAGAANTANVGIVFIGDFRTEPPSAVMVDAARRARGWVAAQCGQADLPYSGHRDHMSTTCPGAWWVEHADWLAGLPEEALPEPENPLPATENGDDMARVAELETILGEMQRIARDELIINLEDALAVKRLPALAREKIAAGALPAAQTIARLGAPED